MAAVMETGERVDDGQCTQFVLQPPVFLQLLTQARIEVIEATCDPDDHRQDEGAGRKHPQQPAPVSRLRGLVDQPADVASAPAGHKAELAVHVEDVLPAADVRVAELHEIRAYERHHALGLEAQFLHGEVGRVLRVNECSDLLLMRESILPAAQARRAECLGPFRVVGHHCAGGEQRVAVEVHAAGARRELAVLPARLLQVVGLVGLVAGERVDAPLHQGVHAVVMLHELQSVDWHLLALQVGENFGFPRRERHLVAREVTHGIDAGVAAHKQCERRVLEDGGKHDDRVALGVAQHQFRGRDAEVGSALQHSLDRIGAGRCRDDRHVETGLTVIALLERRVEAGELELVTPLELQAHRCSVAGKRLGRMDGWA